MIEHGTETKRESFKGISVFFRFGCEIGHSTNILVEKQMHIHGMIQYNGRFSLIFLI